MSFEPTDWKTWTRLEDHPIFGPKKSQIADWSLEPTFYCELGNYGTFMPEWYMHLLPPPPIEIQRAAATSDIAILSDACRQVIENFGSCLHELVILDNFAVLYGRGMIKFR